jgi:hypothetical protein
MTAARPPTLRVSRALRSIDMRRIKPLRAPVAINTHAVTTVQIVKIV